jgi:hypothetical protein
VGTITLVGLNQLWYADYPRSNFHLLMTIEWLQMDKVGHILHHLGRFGCAAMEWSN